MSIVRAHGGEVDARPGSADGLDVVVALPTAAAGDQGGATGCSQLAEPRHRRTSRPLSRLRRDGSRPQLADETDGGTDGGTDGDPP